MNRPPEINHLLDTRPDPAVKVIVAPAELNERATAALRMLGCYSWRECPECDAEGESDTICGTCHGDGCNQCCNGSLFVSCNDCDGLGRLPVDLVSVEAERIGKEITSAIEQVPGFKEAMAL